MNESTVFKNAYVVNEGQTLVRDVRVSGQRITHIEAGLSTSKQDKVIDAEGLYLLPGMIDDQVHFREPGLTHKGNIASESRAAVAGGITSFMEMPNVKPATTTITALERKFAIASERSVANYSFYLGATETNLDEIKALDPSKHCGVKVFMGASTGDLLVEHPEALDGIFRESPTLIVTHCESTPLILENLKRLKQRGVTPQIEHHPLIRDDAACYASSSYAVDLAKKYRSQLHVLHITTAKELSLFDVGPITRKHITAEACVHHLWFSEEDYPHLGNLIKCNPAIKSPHDRAALLKAVQEGRIDIIATDHAPHTLAEKQVAYSDAPAGLPLVEHALLTLLDHVQQQRLSLVQVAEKTAHNPALRYGIEDRGFVREGYFADLVLVDLNQTTLATHKDCHYLCGWTPFDGHEFSSRIVGTWVNGQHAYNGQTVVAQTSAAMRLRFHR